MWKIEIFEDLDGKGVKKTGGYEGPDRASCDKNWPAMTGDDRKPGSYAVMYDPEGNLVARKDW